MNTIKKGELYDVLIIGGGIAGITAGIYVARENFKSALITKDFAGELSHAFVIENYPPFKEIEGVKLLQMLREHLSKFDIEVIEGKQVVETTKKGKIFEVECDDHSKYLGKSLIIATGGMSKRLEIPGENEFLGKGVSYCAVCDGFLYRDKKVAVVGGGNSGVEAALYLAKIAKEVFLFERGDSLKADKISQEKLKNLDNVKVFFSSYLEKIEGKEKVERIKVNIEGKIEEFLIDGVFIYIGYVPVSDFCEKVVKLDEYGQIKVDALTMETSTKGVFAPGDVNNTPFKQAIIAAGQGAVAALGAEKYLRENF